jgi:hypothetical protein
MSSSQQPEIYSFYNENLGDFIRPKADLLVVSKLENAISIVVKHLRQIPGHLLLRKSPEFILRGVTLIENLGVVKADNVLKLDVLKGAFKELFVSVSDAEWKEIVSLVEFFLLKKIVKKIAYYKKVWKFVRTNALPSFFS